MDFELIPSSDTDICDFEEKEALLWKQPTQDSLKEDLEEQHDKSVSPPDDTWMVPPRFKNIEKYISDIEKATNTFMKYNKNDSKIEMWGEQKDIGEAIMRFNQLDENKLEYMNERRKTEKLERAKKKQEPAWGKPQKAPNSKKEEAKLKRREERKREEEIYKKKPDKTQKFPFNVYIVYPYTDIGVSMFFGENEVGLNPLRIETKCHIWFDKPPDSKGIINIVGKTKESVEEATKRVGHLFVKTFKARSIPPNGWIVHALEPPNKPYKIRITDPPSYFYLPYERLNPASQKPPLLKYKLIEPVYEGGSISGVKGSKEINQDFDADSLRRNHEKTITNIKESFLKGLEAVHLLDAEIKMRIRFGRIYLTTDLDHDELIPVKRITSKILSTSKFATCLATKEEQLKRLFEVLSEDGQKELEWDGSPFREFKICAMRTKGDTKDDMENDTKDDTKDDSKDGKEEESLPQCVFDIKFEKNLVKSTYDGKNNEKYEGKIGLWNAVIRLRNVLDINMIGLDGYSWKLNLQSATRLPTNYKSPQGKFVNKLRICQRGRLVYSNTNEVRVISVCEKTKRRFWWKKDYVAEVTKYEYWNLSRRMKITGIEFPLIDEKPPRVSYGVSLYKVSWEDYFSYNSNLKVGEAPDWHPYSIIDEEKNLMSDIKSFSKILQNNHPVQVNNKSYSDE